ncbi:MAG: 30S ribosomal protein S19 [Dorea formicigenerans]
MARSVKRPIADASLLKKVDVMNAAGQVCTVIYPAVLHLPAWLIYTAFTTEENRYLRRNRRWLTQTGSSKPNNRGHGKDEKKSKVR